MEINIKKRYRIKTRPYLCLTPAEAAGTGVTASEETVEELTLVVNSGMGLYQMFAAIKDIPRRRK